MSFVPEVNTVLTIQLPLERLRATVRRVVSDDFVMVELTSVPLAKSHSYKLGDFVGCKRKFDGMAEVWEAQAEMRPAVVKEVTDNAAPARTEERGKQHPRTRAKRAPAKTGRGDRAGQRKASSDANGRKRGAK